MNVSASYISATTGAVVLRGNPVPETSRQAVHFSFLIDASDSMNDGGKLASVRKSMEFLLPLLSPNDAVSLVTFGEGATTLLPLTSASEKDLIIDKIKSLRTDGCTNLSAGLMEAGTVIEVDQARKQGILLLTDGHANRGDSSPDGLKRIVQRLLEDHPGLTLTTVGYGHDHNAGLLSDMATSGGGSYNVVNTLENVATVFGEVLGGLATVVAQNVKIQVSEGIEPTTGYATDAATRTVQIGDLYAENEAILLFNVTDPTTARLQLSYHDMLQLRTVTESLEIAAAPPTIPKNIEIAMFRYKVSEILKETTRSLGRAYGVRNLLTPAQKETAQALLTQLKELTYADEQIVQMMIDDLESLLEAQEVAEVTPGGLTAAAVQATASAWTQHSAYLALGRGLRTASAPLPAEDPISIARQSAVAPPPSPGVGTPEGTPPASPTLGAGPPPARFLSRMAAAWNSAPVEASPPGPLSRTRTARVDPESSPFSNHLQHTTIRSMRQSSQGTE